MNRFKIFLKTLSERAMAFLKRCLVWLRLLFGSFSYQSPEWTKKLQDPENETVKKWKTSSRKSVEWLKLHKKIVLSFLGVILLGIGGYQGWEYYKYNLPHPEWTNFFTNPPANLHIRYSEGKPLPLSIVFHRSVADMSLIGKELKDRVKLTPSIEGKWIFEKDNTLKFYPVKNWEPGQSFTFSFDRKIFGESIELYDYSGSFQTEKFKANVQSSEFYQHPTIPKEKKGVVTLSFNYPVNPATLANRVTARLSDRTFLSKDIKFSIQYSPDFYEAYIHSEFLPIPENDSKLEFIFKEGIQSSLGGNGTEHAFNSGIEVPGMYNYFKISQIRSTVIRNDKFEPEHILIVSTTAGARTEDVAKHLEAYLLPKDNPHNNYGGQSHDDYEDNDQADDEYDDEGNYRRRDRFRRTHVDLEKEKEIDAWESTGEVDKDVRKKMTPIKLETIPSEFENSTTHSFRYKPDVGRWMYVNVKKGLRSFGDYVLSNHYDHVLKIPYLEKELMIMHHGSILSLQGEKKIPILTRNVKKISYKIHRLRPDDLHHLISQTSGDFRSPEFNSYRFSEDNISDAFKEEITVDNSDPTKTQYHSFDFQKYLAAAGTHGPRGIFFFRATDESRNESKKFIVVTDLGLITKKNINNETLVFVQSFSTGRPVSGAKVEVLAINGTTILSATTDDKGQALIPDLNNYNNEKRPVAIVAQISSDMTYIPLGDNERNVSLHRFDIGGIESSADRDKLQVFAFTDRGVYRPGDTTYFGVIAKNLSWNPLPLGLPLEFIVRNAKGTEVLKERFTVKDDGLVDFSYKSTEESPTGNYKAEIYLIERGHRSTLLGSVSFKVEEFLPDRMKILATLSKESTVGWVKSKNIKAKVLLTNLFGTPAQNRKIESEFRLVPAFPSTKLFPDYSFMDPKRGKDTYTERLPSGETDSNGEIEQELEIEKFAAGSYRLEYLAEGFEPEGGRSVSASVSVYISPADYVVGYMADGDLNYLKKDTPRKVEFIAVDHEMKKTTTKKMKMKLVEKKYVSVLTEQSNGTFRYQSVQKTIPVGKIEDVTITPKGFSRSLDTSKDGNYELLITDSEGTEYAKVEYSVFAPSGIGRSLDRNAELQITLNKNDYVKGEEIELSIRAPYTGAGLMTIERGKVYHSEWFKTDTETSIQKIRIPSELEGNAYVSVIFLRALDSKEIYTSPMSYGVAPFTISKDARRNEISLKAPPVVKPGDIVNIKYSAAKPTSIVVYGADEGILQVAGYELPDPLNYFFTKRALQVTTAQILDMLLPELSVFQSVSSSGGDESEGQSALALNLNPFKRKRDKPVAFWSGVLEASEKEKTFTYEVPDYFNGSMRLMAVASSEEALGTKSSSVTVRGDFVLSPNVPLFVAPGDEFEVSVGVSNTSTGSQEAKGAKVKIETSEHLEVISQKEKALDIKEGSEKSETFRLRAKSKLGSGTVKFSVQWKDKTAKSSTDLSVRPAIPYMTDLKMGLVENEVTRVDVTRRMHDEYRKLTLSASLLPMTMAQGLMNYLEKYPYGCTEQIISKGFPTLVLSNHPDFKVKEDFLKTSYLTVVKTLRSRQASGGGFGLWSNQKEDFDFPSLYAIHYLTEAKERGLMDGADLLERSLTYLKNGAYEKADSLHEARLWAYSLYLQVRNSIVPKKSLETLRGILDANFKDEWRGDLTGVYLAGAYALLQQNEEGLKILKSYKRGGAGTYSWNFYYDSSVREAQYLYIAGLYYPEALKDLKAEDFIKLLGPLLNGGYTTINSSYAVLGLNAYLRAIAQSGQSIVQNVNFAELWKGGENKLQLTGGLFPATDFSPKAEVIRIANPSKLKVFYQTTQAGFDLKLPTETIQEGMEIQREYLDRDLKTTTDVKNGSEIWVRLRARTIKDTGAVNNIAVVDLLPGGFEVVADSIRNEGSSGSMAAKYVDIREDRIVVFTDLSSSVSEYMYKIKATNTGTFVVPPAFAESMYDRQIKARGISAGITVSK